MGSSTMFCVACGRLLFPGAALRVIHRRTGRWSAICRPEVRQSCVRQIPGVQVTRLELFDRDAAIEFDKEREAA